MFVLCIMLIYGVHSVFTAHLEVDLMLDVEAYMTLKEQIRMIVEDHGLYHSTVEIEYPGEACRMVASVP